MCNYISKGGILWRSHGSLTYDTKIDKSGFEKGINSLTGTAKNAGTKIKSIITALGITKLISTAISTINNSIDGAVSRLDTLNNFPKVMSNLGIASEESSKAIDTLSKGLQGLPTKLDAGALAVQRFTSKNGDVNKSVDLFLAINNALLAGGASAEIQETALEQLSQAYAKGKPDMMEWRSIQTAMPAQLNQVAKAFGMTSDQLGEALRNGKISMDTFMQKVVELNKNGINGFKSFEEQAKNSVGGIKTSITNAKTAITRGVANIINSVDKALQKTELKGLGEVISKIGKIAENALKGISNAISKIDLNSIIKRIKDIVIIYGTKLKNIVTEIVKGMGKLWEIIIKNKNVVISLISTVLALVVAYKSYQAVLKAIQAINMIKSITSMLNPMGLLIASITALTVAVGLSAAAISNEKRSLGGLREEAEAQQTTWANLKKAREDSLSNSLAEIVTIQKLADELREITDENGKVKEGYENRAKYILGELNKALGTEYTMNGNIISQYEDLKTNIDNLITAKKAEATLDAYKSEYQQAIKNEQEATKTLTGLKQKYNEELSKSTKGYAEEAEKQRNLAHIGNEIKKQTELIGEYGYTIQNYEKLTSASVSGNAEEINKAIESMGVSYDQAKEKTNSSLSEQIRSQSNYVQLLNQSWQDAVKNNDTYQSQILQKQIETQDEELSNLAKSLAQQTSTVGELSEEQKNAWNDLASKSITAYNDGLSSLDSDTRNKIEQATGITVEEQTLPNGMKTLAKRAADGYSLRLDLSGKTTDNMVAAQNTMQRSNAILDGATKLADDEREGFNKFDAVTEGSNATKRYASGMTAPGPISVLTNAANGLAAIVSSFLHFSEPDVGPLSDFHTYMPDMIDNLVNGIEKNKYKLSNAVQSLSADMEKRLQDVVNLEIGKTNATATVKSNAMYNSVIQINANFDGNVEMDSTRVGRLVAPSVTRTIKAGGLA